MPFVKTLLCALLFRHCFYALPVCFFLLAFMFDLPEQITVWNELSNDGAGVKTWSAPITSAARIAFKQEKFTDQNGDQLMSTAVCYSEASTLVINSRVLFGVSVDADPPSDANDARALSNTPSGAGGLKKAWFA